MWIKICGIRDVETALAVAALEPQAIGLNFFDRSPRQVSPEVAAEIVTRLPKSVEPVGVFVNHSVDQIDEICRRTGLKTIQLHGDEPPEMLARLSSYRVIRAFRIGAEGMGEMAEYLRRCEQQGASPFACLVDARVEGVYGGSGKKAPWDVVRDGYQMDEWPPLILAGGLTPANVAEAIRVVRPWGVDVAGGVESSRACTDLALVREFVERIRSDE